MDQRPDLRHPDPDPGVSSLGFARLAGQGKGMSARLPHIPTEYLILGCLALFPLGAYADALGSQLTILLIFAILALGLNVVVGNTGLLHLGIAAFFGLGAYVTGILTISGYPFQIGFYGAAVVATL